MWGALATGWGIPAIGKPWRSFTALDVRFKNGLVSGCTVLKTLSELSWALSHHRKKLMSGDTDSVISRIDFILGIQRRLFQIWRYLPHQPQE